MTTETRQRHDGTWETIVRDAFTIPIDSSQPADEIVTGAVFVPIVLSRPKTPRPVPDVATLACELQTELRAPTVDTIARLSAVVSGVANPVRAAVVAALARVFRMPTTSSADAVSDEFFRHHPKHAPTTTIATTHGPYALSHREKLMCRERGVDVAKYAENAAAMRSRRT